MLHDTYAAGHLYVSDVHARAVGTQHPDGNLWDNGADAIAELEATAAGKPELDIFIESLKRSERGILR